MNVCKYEFIDDAKCSEILISKIFPNGIIFIDSSFYLHQMLNKSIRLGHSDSKPNQKEITRHLN